MLRTIPHPHRRKKAKQRASENDNGEVEKVLDQVRKSLARSRRVLEGQVQNEDRLDSSLLEKSVMSGSKRSLKSTPKKLSPRPKKGSNKKDRFRAIDQNHLEGLLASVENLLKGTFDAALVVRFTSFSLTCSLFFSSFVFLDSKKISVFRRMKSNEVHKTLCTLATIRLTCQAKLNSKVEK